MSITYQPAQQKEKKNSRLSQENENQRRPQGSEQTQKERKKKTYRMKKKLLSIKKSGNRLKTDFFDIYCLEKTKGKKIGFIIRKIPETP